MAIEHTMRFAELNRLPNDAALLPILLNLGMEIDDRLQCVRRDYHFYWKDDLAGAGTRTFIYESEDEFRNRSRIDNRGGSGRTYPISHGDDGSIEPPSRGTTIARNAFRPPILSQFPSWERERQHREQWRLATHHTGGPNYSGAETPPTRVAVDVPIQKTEARQIRLDD